MAIQERPAGEDYPRAADYLYRRAVELAQKIQAPAPGRRRKTREREVNYRRELVRQVGGAVAHLAANLTAYPDLAEAIDAGRRSQTPESVVDEAVHYPARPSDNELDVADAVSIAATVSGRPVSSWMMVEMSAKPGMTPDGVLSDYHDQLAADFYGSPSGDR